MIPQAQKCNERPKVTHQAWDLHNILWPVHIMLVIGVIGLSLIPSFVKGLVGSTILQALTCAIPSLIGRAILCAILCAVLCAILCTVLCTILCTVLCAIL